MTTENIDIGINRKGNGGKVIKRELDDIANSAEKVDTSIKSLSKSALLIGGAIGAAIGGSLTMLYKGFTNAAQGIKETYTAAKQLGTTTEIFSRLDFAARSYDMTTKDLTSSLEVLQRTQVQAAKGNNDQAKIFKQLGISATDAAGALRETPEVLRDIADIFQKMPDGANKSALAVKLFGNANREMISLLNQGSQGLDEMANKSDELGYTVDQVAAQDLKEFYDQMDDVKLQVEAMYRQALPTLIPLLKDLSGTLDSQEFKDGFNAIIQGAAQAIVWLAKFATTTANVTKFLAEEVAARAGGTDPQDTVRVEQRIERLKSTIADLQELQSRPLNPVVALKAIYSPSSEVSASDMLRNPQQVIKRLQGELDQEQNKLKLGIELNDAEAAKAAKALREAQEAAAQAQVGATGGNPPAVDWTGLGNTPRGPKGPDPEKALQRLQREFENTVGSINPVLSAQKELARAQDTFNRAVDAGLISQKDADHYMELYNKQLKDQLDPLGALNDELAEQLRISKLLGDERAIEQNVYGIQQQLIRAGIELTKEQTDALREQLKVLQERDKLGAAKENILEGSSGRKKEQAGINLQAFNEIKDQLSEGDKFNFLNQMLGGSLEDTQAAFDARIEQYQTYYDIIEQFRQQDVNNEKLATEAKRAVKIQEWNDYMNLASNALGVVAGLMQSSNKKAFKIGQAAAIAQATIAGIQSAINAYNSGMQIGGPIGPAVGAAFMAVSIATTAAQISKIRAQQPPQFRTGGSMVVGGSGGIDSQTVALRATPGERISINTPSQARALDALAARAAEDKQPQVFNSSVTIVQQGRPDNRTSEQEARALTKAQRKQFERNN